MERRASAEEKIGAFQRFGWKLGLERTRALCSPLGDPQNGLNVIHVAGTNGKGSVCRYLYEALRAHGYTAGLFTSPGLGDFRSRIEANGEWISEGDLDLCTDRALAAAEKMSGTDAGPPTEFEVLTAVAFAYFASKRLDFVILEVGLGGSADATNVVASPLVSVITAIGFDHTDYLGNTTEKIAGEKAGIIKPGRPVVTSASGEAARVIARRAYELGAPLVYARADVAGGADGRGERGGGVRTRIIREGLDGAVFSCEIGGVRYDNIEIGMAGRHQVENAVCALAAFDVLRRMKRVDADGASLRKGMKASRLPGRFQIVSGGPEDPCRPLVILDGAHNPEGATALRDAVRALLPGKKVLALIAMMRDKQADVILKEIRSFADGAVFTETSNKRGMDAAALAEIWSGVDPGNAPEAVIRDMREAYTASVARTRADARSGHSPPSGQGRTGRQTYDALVVCGSLYLVSDLISRGIIRA
jgi:dihydrofolate synthase/folylpolyglutamate synthase